MPNKPREEGRYTMLTFAEAAEQLVEDGIVANMTAEGLRRMARQEPDVWPIKPGDYRIAGRTRMLPYELLVPYMRERMDKRRGRGADKEPRKKRTE